MKFNVFDAAPENERDGPSQQAAQNAGGKVRTPDYTNDDITECSIYSATGVFPIDLHNDSMNITILSTTACSPKPDLYEFTNDLQAHLLSGQHQGNSGKQR